MLRLLLSLLCGLAIAASLLLVRQQRIELQHQCNALHDQMLGVQKQLWQQQLQIAAAVSPAGLRAVLASHEERAAAGAAQQAGEDSADAPGDWAVYRR